LPRTFGESRSNIVLPSVPMIPRVPHSLKRSKGYSNVAIENPNACSRPMTSHQRNVSDSSNSSAFSTTSFTFDSDDNTQSTTTTPSSSRSSSPCENQASTSFRLIRRSEPFPPNLGLSDLTAEDALVFYPDSESSSRAILLLGPAIARHLHMQDNSSKPTDPSGRSRVHRYRITASRHASMCRDADRAMLLSLKKQLEKAKREERTGWGLWTRGGSLDQRLRNSWHEQRRKFRINDVIVNESASTVTC